MKSLLLVSCLALLVWHVQFVSCEEDEEGDDPYTTMDPSKREPHPCEICKYFATELRDRLEASSKSKEVIETGHGLERKKRFKYLTSELRLTEALLEPHICENILKYNVHAERKGSLRYAKGMSETFETLHGLVGQISIYGHPEEIQIDKGVKVDLGIPYDLWDKPSAEVSKMHRWCFNLAEQYEDDIEDWYYKHQDKDLFDYLCRERYLKDKKSTDSCLGEELQLEEPKKKAKKKKSKRALKGDTSSDEVPAKHTEL